MNNAVKGYFDKAVSDFDSIYEGKGPFGRWVDLHFRRDMYERYRLTFETCGDVYGKTILDIGCGSGRYSVEFAKRYTDQVIGIDLAPNMIMAARKHAEEHNVLDRCNFIIGDFMRMEFRQRFDICIAIGVFDYIAQPQPFLEKMRSLSNKWMIMSFPSISVVRTSIRKIRYWFKNCPVYFYDREAIRRLICGLGEYQIVKIPGQGMDYFVNIHIL